MSTTASYDRAHLELDPKVPLVRIFRDFNATPEQLLRAHTDPELYARWVGPNDVTTRIDTWDARSGGSWAFTNFRGDEQYSFHGSFHEVSPERIVQTFAFDGMPQEVLLETMQFEDLGNGRTRLHAKSLVDSFEGRDAMVASGMESGLQDGYDKLDRILAEQ